MRVDDMSSKQGKVERDRDGGENSLSVLNGSRRKI